jgi:putative ABC transport system permease protein
MASGASKRRPKPAGIGARARAMAEIGIAMMFHNKLRLIGTMAGVVFAVILSNQALGTFFGLIYKNTMLVDNAKADIWLAPLGTESLVPGRYMSTATLDQALVTKGVASAKPLLLSGAVVSLPSGGSEGISLVGVKVPYRLGGPWNMVVGDVNVLHRPDTMLFEDSYRSNFGNMNLGSVREVSGRRIVAGGFTWGLSPFTGPYAFADYDLAREISHTPRDRTSFVLIQVAPGHSVKSVKDELKRRVPDAMVLDKSELNRMITRTILVKTPIGITFGVISAFGLLVGIVVVSLAMFSSVIDNIREFGTLKAIGVKTSDLAMLLLVQSALYGILGSLVGLTVVTLLSGAIRSPKLALVLPHWLTGATVFIMIGMCAVASGVALLRLRKVEPAMVFR